MKNRFLATGALILLSLFITRCKKDSAAPAPTALQVTVRSNTTATVSGATVSLFADSTDFVNNTNALTTGISDGKGLVTFSGLSAVKYYFFAQSGCNNNFNSGSVLKNPLALNRTTSVDAVIYGTGSLEFSNTSANPFTIYVNGTDIGVLNGGTTFTATNVPVASYSIRVLQNSGYTVTPTDETFSESVSCGNLQTATFP